MDVHDAHGRALLVVFRRGEAEVEPATSTPPTAGEPRHQPVRQCDEARRIGQIGPSAGRCAGFAHAFCHSGAGQCPQSTAGAANLR